MPDDFEELLKLFNKKKVKYCVIGAYAFAFHVRPRYTKDMDLLVRPDRANAAKIVSALKDFGFESLKLSQQDFIKKNQVVQLGYEPYRIDLITSIEGLSFDEIWKGKLEGKYKNTDTYFIGRKELIKAKEIAHRPQDMVDLNLLKKDKKRRSHNR